MMTTAITRIDPLPPSPARAGETRLPEGEGLAAATPSPSHCAAVGFPLSHFMGEGNYDWLLLLASWLSPSYPVGAYSYSHGIEWGVEIGTIGNIVDLADYIATVMEVGAGWCDLVLASTAWQAASAGLHEELDRIIELGLALRGTSEMALETLQQGTAFVSTTRAAWPGTPLDALGERHSGGIVYPVAVGIACVGRVPLEPMLTALSHAIAANLVSAGVRLIPLGQTDGQRTLAALGSVLMGTVERAVITSLDDLGTAAPGIDLYSMKHESQYTRLFRS